MIQMHPRLSAYLLRQLLMERSLSLDKQDFISEVTHRAGLQISVVPGKNKRGKSRQLFLLMGPFRDGLKHSYLQLVHAIISHVIRSGICISSG